MIQIDDPHPAPDFNDPLGLLSACHDRILQHCDLLERLLEHLDDKGSDDEARQAAAAILRYFDTAGRLHHQDEEQDLFPRLVRTSLKMAELIHELRQEHERLDRLWDPLSASLQRLQDIDLNALRGQAEAFIEASREHVRRENGELLSVARHLLSEKEQRRIGEAMAERRDVRV